MMAKVIWRSLAVALVFTLLWISNGGAQDNPPTPQPVTDDQVNAIAKDMYCPVCENTPLDVCPTQACAEWRELIRDKLSEGWNKEQIRTFFVDRFGDRVLAEPPARGINWLVYIIPPLAFIAGAYLLFRAFKSWSAPTPEPALKVENNNKAAERDPYIERLEEELRKS